MKSMRLLGNEVGEQIGGRNTLKPALATASGTPLVGSRQSVSQAALYLQAFILIQIACQVLLLFDRIGGARILVRAASFGSSLIFLFLISGSRKKHPAQPWIIAILVIMAANILHPTTNSILAGVAQITLYTAILSPMFWVSRLTITPSLLTRLLFILWGFHTLSAFVGVLQMYYPGQFQPSVSTTIEGLGEMAEGFKIELANGEYVWRPMGLTDIPGGAASAGLYAFLFGLGFFFYSRSWVFKVASSGSMAIGLFCIYLSEVRSLFVMAVICAFAFAAILLKRGELHRFVGIVVLVLIVLVGSFTWAVSIGGESTINRFATLTEEDAGSVYYKNRGHFLEYTVNELLPKYPLGAGLGRWGMMNNYFGDRSNPLSRALWAEIQWTGWLFDGGVPLILAYSGALIVTSYLSWQIAMSKLPGDMPLWGALVLAYNVGAAAITFNYPLFVGQGGLEFWLLNSVLFAAAVYAFRQQKAANRNKNRIHSGSSLDKFSRKAIT